MRFSSLERLWKHEHIAWGKAVGTGKQSQDSLCLLMDVKGLEADLHYPELHWDNGE